MGIFSPAICAIQQVMPNYNIKNAALFDGVAGTLSKTLVTATNSKVYTFSFWTARSKLSFNQAIIRTAANLSFIMFGYSHSDEFRVSVEGGLVNGVVTTEVERDVTAWQHYVVAVDTTQSVPSNRVKIYKNGTQITSMRLTNYPGLNTTSGLNNAVLHRIGNDGAGELFSGYIAAFHLIDGQVLAPLDFGKTDVVTGKA